MADYLPTRLHGALEGRYAVERELGEGGMATVYLAEDLKHRRHVALKVLKPELAAVVGAERFLAEIETTARLQHPNILPLFDSGEADGFLFYVMPYVEGESLQDRLKREKQLPVDDAVRIATEVAEALGSAHEHGVIHRDIKPANIMLSQGRPLLADFGIALAVNAAGGHRLTETGLSLGTPHYMSPEQATGDQAVGPASDVYSLGCVLYEMLVGEPPYTGSTAQAILGKVITTEPSRVTAERRAVPANVDATVARALEKVPADRFASARDFAAALMDESYRHGAVSQGPAAASKRVRTVAAVGWAAAMVMGGLWVASPSGSETAPEARRFNLAYPDGAGPSEWLELTPDGSALILSDRPRGDPAVSLLIQRFDGGPPTPIPNSLQGYDPASSPDGTEVAFGGARGLFVASLAGGAPRTLVGESGACCIRWATDGYIYFTTPTRDIARVRATGGAVEEVLPAGAGEDLAYFQPVGDGRRAIVDVVAMPGGEVESHRIDWVDVETGVRHPVVEGRRPFLTEDGYLIFGRGEAVYAGRLDTRSMELVGEPVRMVERVGVTDVDAMYTLSESGDLAYWISYGDADTGPLMDLIWVDRAGRVSSVDTSFTREIETVALSPDGSRAAVTLGFNTRTEIWIKDLDDGPALRLTNHPGMNRRPVWSPDGTEVAFISDRGGRRAAYVVSVNGIDTPRLLLEHDGKDVDEVQWSADGDWLIYRTGTVPGDRDVYARRLRPDTQTVVVSAEPEVDEVSPMLSPDGRWVAYTSDVTGDQEVWIRPFPDVERGSRQISTDAGVEPTWSLTGELFFRSRPGVMVASLAGGEQFRVSMETMFSNSLSMWSTLHRSFSHEEERDRFLMIRELGVREIPAELILVQNFMDEVRRRVGG